MDKDRIINHIGENFKKGCPMCNGMDWDICDGLSSSYPLSNKNSSYEWEQKGKINPVVEVICLHCGFVAGISTLVMK